MFAAMHLFDGIIIIFIVVQIMALNEILFYFSNRIHEHVVAHLIAIPITLISIHICISPATQQHPLQFPL